MCLSGHREFHSSMLGAIMPGQERRGQIRSRSRTGPVDTVSRSFAKTTFPTSHVNRCGPAKTGKTSRPNQKRKLRLP